MKKCWMRSTQCVELECGIKSAEYYDRLKSTVAAPRRTLLFRIPHSAFRIPHFTIIVLALFLTLFVMSPVAIRVNNEAVQPMLAGQITQTEALTRAFAPVRGFMLKHTRERDLALFLRLSASAFPRTPEDVPTTALIP